MGRPLRDYDDDDDYDDDYDDGDDDYDDQAQIIWQTLNKATAHVRPPIESIPTP